MHKTTKTFVLLVVTMGIFMIVVNAIGIPIIDSENNNEQNDTEMFESDDEMEESSVSVPEKTLNELILKLNEMLKMNNKTNNENQENVFCVRCNSDKLSTYLLPCMHKVCKICEYRIFSQQMNVKCEKCQTQVLQLSSADKELSKEEAWKLINLMDKI
ncbi:uncharacterized protein LOC126904714 [Daktulosphaira vitifoliae]|uniref:uncharacterized protein LOC126904714 n=1 Tax=Daktulosphaira vitifoliae TaxID=58002 RepID=UPI0021AA023C|nr:uncharacterized protein LOC126904714 [Daktulosphaira vitifoliae]